MAGLGFTVPGSTAGSALGPANIAGGIAALLQGLTQGKEIKQQRQEQQQQLDDQRLNSSLSALQALSGMNPQLLSSPMGAQLIQGLQQRSGGALPDLIDPSTGKVNTALFMKPLSSQIGTPGYEQAMAQDPGSYIRQQYATQFYGTPEETAAFVNAPKVYSGAEIDKAAQEYSYYMGLINNGADPRALVPILNQKAKVSGDPQVTVNAQGQVIPVGGDTGLGMSAKTAAQVDAITTKTKWMNKFEPAEIAKMEAETGFRREQIAEMPQRLQVAVSNMMTARKRADIAQAQLTLDQQKFQQIGTLDALKGLMAQDTTALNDSRTAWTSAQDLATKFAAANAAATKPLQPGVAATDAQRQYQQLQAAANNAKARYNQALIEHKNLAKNYQPLAQQALTRAGGKSSWQTNDNTNGNSGGNAGGNTGVRTITQAQFEAARKKNKMSEEQARAYVKSQGITVTP